MSDEVISGTEVVAAEKTATNSRAHLAAHLAPYKFQPGKSGNPSGRPKKVAGAIERKATKKVLDQIAAALLAKAGANPEGECSVDAFREIRDTIDGPIERNSSNNAISIEVVIGSPRRE
jgi:hypothetical protein